MRLENAKTLLIDSNQTVTEIAARTGFNTPALFSHNFHQYVGISPSYYRQTRTENADHLPRRRDH